MLWPFVARLTRSALEPARRSRRPAGRDGRGLGGRAAERLETRRMLAATISLTSGVLTVAFDDAANDAVSLSITPTGFLATGANVPSGTGTVSQLVVTDAGTVKTSSLTLLQADQTLTGGLSIAANVTAASIADSVTTNGGAIKLEAPTTLAAITLASGSGNQTFSGGITLAGDMAITATGGGNVAVSGGVTTAAGQTPGLTVNAGTAGAVTFSGVASTIVGNVAVTARNIVISADLVSTSGDIVLVGDAGSTVAGVFQGVYVFGSGVEVKTLATGLVAGATGAISVRGRGGDAVAAGSGTNPAFGVYLQQGASISAGGSGDVSVTGIGGVSTTDGFNSGVLVSNSNAANGVSEIITAGGSITVTGTAGGAATNAADNYGVSVNNFARIAAGGSGNVSVIGTATGTGGSGNSGVIVTNSNLASQTAPTAAITSAGGNITITGTGTADGAAVVLRNAGKVASGGSGNVTIVADSVRFDTDDWKAAPPATIGSVTAGAAGDATVTIRPRTAGTLIDLGGPDSLANPLTLGLSTEEIDRINAGTLAVGSASAGRATVSVALAPANASNLAIRSAAGVTLRAGVTTTGGTITIDDGAGGDTAVVVAAGVTLDTTAAGSVATGAAVTIRGTVTSDTTNYLTITGGTTGDVLVTGTIGAVGGGGDFYSLLISGNDITLASIDGVVARSAINAADGTDAGSLTLTGQTYRITGGVDLSSGAAANPLQLTGGAAGATTTITTSGGQVEISGALDLNARNLSIDITGAGAVPVGGDLRVNQSINGAGAFAIDAGFSGVVTLCQLGGDIGAITPLTSFTITNANQAFVVGSLFAGTLTVSDTSDFVQVAGVLTLTGGLITAAELYNLRFLGGDSGANSIAGTTTFLNTGTLSFGDQGPGDVFTFVGGVVAIAPAAIQLSATIAATTGAITVGDADTLVTVVGAARIGGASTGAITLGGIQLDSAAQILLGTGVANVIQTGAITGIAGGFGENVTIATTGAATVTGAIGTGIGNLTITNSGGTTFQSTVAADLVTITDTTGTVTFEGALTAAGLTTNSKPYAVAMLGSGTTITSATTFANSGGVTLGNGGDTITFAGGVTSVAGPTTLAGTVVTTDASFGVVTLAADATLTAGGDVTFTGPVEGAHGLNVANAANVTFGSDVGQVTPLADLTVTAPTGTIDASERTITAGGVAFNSANQMVGSIETTGGVSGSAGSGNLTLNATRFLFALRNLTASRDIATGTGDAIFAPTADTFLQLTSRNGSVTFGGNVTAAGFGGGLAVNAAATITFSGGLNECGSTSVRLDAGATGDILFRGGVRDLDTLSISSAANVTAEAAISDVGAVAVSSAGTVRLADVSSTFVQEYAAATVKLAGGTYATGGGEFWIRGSAEIGTGVADEVVTITTSGGTVQMTGGAEGIYAARPSIAPSLIGPAAIVGSGTSLTIDAGQGTVLLGALKGFGSGGPLGRPLADVTLAGSLVELQSPDNLVAGTLSAARGQLVGSGTVGSLAFDPAAGLSLSIGGLTPVTGYGQLTVDATGTVALGSAALMVSASVPVPLGTVLTIIDNQGSAAVSGTFAGLPEGATVVRGDVVFEVSYVGGDGNDVTLEAIAGDVVVSVVDDRVVIMLAPTGTTVTNLSTRYFPGSGRLVITVAADQALTGGGTGVTVNDTTDTVTVNLAQLPGFAGFDVIGSTATDLITVGPGGINLAAVARGAASQSVSITTGTGAGDTVTITQPVSVKGSGSFSLATAASDSAAGIRLGTTVRAPRGPQIYVGPVTLVGPSTLTAGGMSFSGAVDGAHRLTVSTASEVAFLANVGTRTPLAGVTIQRATSVEVLLGFRLDGTGLGPQASGLVVGRGVNSVSFSDLGTPSDPPARSIVGFGGSGILFQGGSTGSTIRTFALIGNGRGITFQPGNYAGTAVRANTIAASGQIGVSLNAARGLSLGGAAAGEGNEITAGAAARAYATGVFAQGNLAGTQVTGNAIALNSGTGVILSGARGIQIGGGPGNAITTNGGWGLVASGLSTGSVVAGNTISGNTLGQVNVRRARGLRVVG